MHPDYHGFISMERAPGGAIVDQVCSSQPPLPQVTPYSHGVNNAGIMDIP
jgi:hypothetical protein